MTSIVNRFVISSFLVCHFCVPIKTLGDISKDNKDLKPNHDFGIGVTENKTSLKTNETSEEKLSQEEDVNKLFLQAILSISLISDKPTIDSPEKAIEKFDRIISLKPDFAEAYWARGLVEQFVNKQKEALADFNKSIEINPKFAETYLSRAALYSKMQQLDLAIDDYGSFLELDNVTPEISIQIQLEKKASPLILNTPLYSTAQEEFTPLDKTKREKQQRAKAYYARGSLRLNRYKASRENNKQPQENINEIIQDFNKAVELSPESSIAFYGRASIKKEELNDLAGFDEDFKKAKELDRKKEVNIDLRKVYKLFFAKQYNEALVELNNLLSQAPDEQKHEIYSFLGDTYEQIGNINSAINSFTKAIELKPDYERAYFRRGALYNSIANSKNFFNGDSYKAAVSDFLKVIEINKNNADAYYSIASIAYRGERNVALSLYLQKHGGIENCTGTGFLQMAQKLYEEQNNEGGKRRVATLQNKFKIRQIEAKQRNLDNQIRFNMQQIQHQYK